MLYTMLCLVLLVFTLTGRCRGDSNNSSMPPMLLLPPAPASHRMSAAQVHSLRRQLMRDNYDYQHSSDDIQRNITASSGGDTKVGIDHLPRDRELVQTNSNAFRVERVQEEHYKQRGQRDQPGEYGRRGQYEQHDQHVQGHHHKQRGDYEHRGQYEQLTEHEQRGQYPQPGELEQRGQYDQRDQYEQHGPHKLRGQRKHHIQHKEREHREQRGQNKQRGSHEQRKQNKPRKHSEQQEQLGQLDEEEQPQSIEQKPRAAPSDDDAPFAPPVAVRITNELNVREYTTDRHDIQRDQAKEYVYDLPYPAPMQRKPFSDLRGNYKEQYGQNDVGNDMRAQEELASDGQESPDQEYAPDEQAFDQQEASGLQDNEGSDFSVSKKQPKIYNDFVTGSNTRANHLQYYTRASTERNEPSHRVHNSLSHHDHSSSPHRNALDHNILKKDLLYYMDDNQMRRRNHNDHPDVPDEDQPEDDQHSSPHPRPRPSNPAVTRTSPGTPARHPAPTEGRPGGELPRTARARRSFVVTVSPANVTYKLLMLKSRSGRRQDERRILEERGPAGVAIMSLDHAPLPAFRLPRARRQYMHAPHHHRRHESA